MTYSRIIQEASNKKRVSKRYSQVNFMQSLIPLSFQSKANSRRGDPMDTSVKNPSTDNEVKRETLNSNNIMDTVVEGRMQTIPQPNCLFRGRTITSKFSKSIHNQIITSSNESSGGSDVSSDSSHKNEVKQ